MPEHPPQYARKACALAWRTSWDAVFEKPARAFVIAGLLLCFSAALTWRFQGLTEMVSLLFTALVSAGAMALTFSVLYLVNLFWFTPRRMWHDACGAQAEATSRQSKREAFLFLQTLALMGERLLMSFHTDFEQPLTLDDAEWWVNSVTTTLQKQFPLWEDEFYSALHAPPVPLDLSGEAMRLVPDRAAAIRELWPKVYALKQIVAHERAALALEHSKQVA